MPPLPAKPCSCQMREPRYCARQRNDIFIALKASSGTVGKYTQQIELTISSAHWLLLFHSDALEQLGLWDAKSSHFRQLPGT